MTDSPRYSTLDEWLAWQQTLHAREIELGLGRIAEVAKKLDLIELPFRIVTVGGTNGKGSSVTMLGTILHRAGYRVGTYTSPHISRYNERIRIDLQCVEDHELCESFEKIDRERGETSLSFFEFGTLTAFDVFVQREIDIAILEVGMGGRLDAVNILEPDLTFVTNIGLDHTEWLGETREAIGYEKAGIFRPAIPAICGDLDPPKSLLNHADKLGAQLLRVGRDYHYEINETDWSFKNDGIEMESLPLPNLPGDIQVHNAAGVLQGVHCLREFMRIDDDAIEKGLREVTLDGRFQRIRTHCEIIFDVAHNRESASVLADNLAALPSVGKTIAVFSVLKDKDIAGILKEVGQHIDVWYVSTVSSHRAMLIEEIQQVVSKSFPNLIVKGFDSVQAAYVQAQQDADSNDRVLVFGSIFTVAEALSRTQ